MATCRYTIPIHQNVSTGYASDLNDQESALLTPHVAQKDGPGKKRTVDIREVLNAIFYRTRTGCQWRMLPSDFPAWYHVWYYLGLTQLLVCAPMSSARSPVTAFLGPLRTAEALGE